MSLPNNTFSPGIVIEVAEIRGKPLVLYCECLHFVHKMPIGLCLNKTFVSEKIEIGDFLRWQSFTAYWTPKNLFEMTPEQRQQGGFKYLRDYDVRIQMQELSGYQYPGRPYTKIQRGP